LVENGLVDKEPHRLYKVKDLDLKLLNELYELRNAIETYAVARAVETMSASVWQQLFDFWSKIPGNLPNEGMDLTQEDEKFHETIAASTKNNTLLQSLQSINERLRFIRLRDYSTPERLRQTYEQHLSILMAIRNQGVSDAQEAMREHIDMAHSNVETIATHALAKAYILRNSSEE
jgi:DNA-binding GntR family transcriptional regulator